MANKSTSMLKLRRIIQAKISGESKSSISRKIPIHRTILDKYLSRIEDSGQSMDNLLKLSDDELSKLLNPAKVQYEDKRFTILKGKMESILKELSLPHVTLQQLWLEYAESEKEHYSYSQFCEHIAKYKQIKSATMHFEHTPGEYMEVDFAGAKLPIYDITGTPIYYPVIVVLLPFSSLTYMEVLEDASQENLFLSLNNALRYFGGVPLNVKSDNMKQFVTKNNRYEFSFNDLGEQWALHYNTYLAATRVRKPKDKATVEGAVNILYHRVYSKLRNDRYTTLNELNNRVWILMEEANNIPFQKCPGSRRSIFEEIEKERLRQLPTTDFVIKHTVNAKVQRNYHVIVGEDNHQYSVPFKYIGETLTVIYDHYEVEIFNGLERVALHKRDKKANRYTTLKDHMPKAHQYEVEARGWNPEFFLEFASDIGESALKIFTTILNSNPVVEQTYKSCIGLKRLAERYGNERMEAACERALPGRHNYTTIRNILEKGLDMEPNPFNQKSKITIMHPNIRGEKYYS